VERRKLSKNKVPTENIPFLHTLVTQPMKQKSLKKHTPLVTMIGNDIVIGAAEMIEVMGW